MKFFHKPLVIEAVQFDGSRESFETIKAWTGFDKPGWIEYPDPTDPRDRLLDGPMFVIRTSDDSELIHKGDWVIRDRGRIRRCRGDIFKETYTPIVAPETAIT